MRLPFGSRIGTIKLPRFSLPFSPFSRRKESDRRIKEEIQLLKKQLAKLEAGQEELNKRFDETRGIFIENITIEKLYLDKMQLELGSINVQDLSGALNVGITCAGDGPETKPLPCNRMPRINIK